MRRKPSWKTKAASAAETRSLRSLQVGSTIRSQNRAIASRALPVLGQPVGEADVVQGLAGGRAQRAQRRQGAQGGRLLARRQQRVGRERGPRWSGRRQGRGAQRARAAPPRSRTGTSRRLLEHRVAQRAEQSQQGHVGRAAAQEDVLAVVDLTPGVGVAEAVGLAAEEGPPLHQRDPRAPPGGLARRPRRPRGRRRRPPPTSRASPQGRERFAGPSGRACAGSTARSARRRRRSRAPRCAPRISR